MNHAVSVLMPVYNAQRFVAGAVESILNQTFRDFELQIIDDGSTDGSLSILKRYAEQDSRIRLVSRPNAGLVGTLNEMLETARGEFIARMDADDVSLPERFEKQVQALRASPEIGVIGGQVEVTDPEGRALWTRNVPQGHSDIDAEHIAGRTTAIVHPAAMFRAQALRWAGGYRKDYWPAEDLDLFLRLAEQSRVANHPDVILRYRLHLASICHSQGRVQTQAVRRAVADARIRRGLKPGPTPFRHDGSGWFRSARVYRMWARWALEGGELDLARKYAWGALWRRPFSYPSWKLAISAARGKP